MFEDRYSNVPYTKINRRQLRNHSSPPEKRLWLHLKNSQLEGFKFRRQHGIDRYILDFYCPAKNLAIEIDGKTHDNQQSFDYDQRRTNHLSSRGITVLRFTNKDIMNNLEGVLAEIKNHL